MKKTEKLVYLDKPQKYIFSRKKLICFLPHKELDLTERKKQQYQNKSL